MFQSMNDFYGATNKQSQNKVKYTAIIFTVWDPMSSQ